MKRVLVVASFLAAAAVGMPVLGQDTTTGLVSHWPMDTVGATTPDVVGPNTFTGVNGPTASAGFIGGAVRLNGTDEHLTAADAASLNFGTGSFTVALWIRPTSTASVRLINKWDGPVAQGWIMDIHSTTGGGALVNALRFRVDSNTAGGDLDYSTPAGLGSGAWKHVAAVVDRTAANQLRLYVNGALVGSAQTLPAALGSLSNTFQLGLGTIPSAAGKYYGGDVDDVRLYNRPLTAADLGALVAPPPPVLVDPPSPGNGQVTLTWAAVPGAVSYQVYFTANPAAGFTASGPPTTATTATVTGLTNGTTYAFVVTANNGIANSVNSNVVSGTPVPPPPRLIDHEEGLLGDNCACGAAAFGPALGWAFLAAAALLPLGKRRVV